jgi:hypothetical protein
MWRQLPERDSNKNADQKKATMAYWGIMCGGSHGQQTTNHQSGSAHDGWLASKGKLLEQARGFSPLDNVIKFSHQRSMLITCRIAPKEQQHTSQRRWGMS